MSPVAAAIGSPAHWKPSRGSFSTALSSPSPVLLTCLKVKVTPRTCFGFVSLFYPLISIISAKENSGWPFPVFIHRPSWLRTTSLLFYLWTQTPPFSGRETASLPKGDLGRRGVREAQAAERWAALCLDRQTDLPQRDFSGRRREPLECGTRV